MVSRSIGFSALTAAVILSSAALAVAAEGIDPRCVGMRDKVGCTCAVQNGGSITSKGWRSQRTGGYAAAVNEAYIACMKRRGRG